MDACDEVFEVTEHDLLVIHQDRVIPELSGAIREAVRLCPRGALSLG